MIACSYCKYKWHKNDLLTGYGENGQMVDICPNCRQKYKLDVCTQCSQVVCMTNVDKNHVCRSCQRDECTLDQMEVAEFMIDAPVESTPISRRTFMTYIEPAEIKALEQKISYNLAVARAFKEEAQYGKGTHNGMKFVSAYMKGRLFIFMRPSDISKLEKEMA